MAVTELMLTSVGAKRLLAIPSQKSVTTAPHKKHPGIKTMGFAVLVISFTRCGTAMPTKEIGPSKAAKSFPIFNPATITHNIPPSL